MEPREMFNQITATYGKPTPAALLQNDMLFQSVYSPNDAPEVLFRRIEDCQEVQILGEDPYTAQQLLNNAVVRLLLQCGLYTRILKIEIESQAATGFGSTSRCSFKNATRGD